MLIQAINDMPKTKKIKLILREKMIKKDLLIKKVKEQLPKINIKLIKSQTKGQASTCLLGLEKNDLQNPLLISACDNGVIYDYQKFKTLTKDDSIDIIVWGSRNYPGALKNPEMYGWIKEKDNIVEKVFVKQVYKDPATDPVLIGTFYFKKAEFFKRSAEYLIKSNETVNNEFYVDSSINKAINLGFKVAYFEVDFYLCCGTPNDLKTFNYWQNCFHKWESHMYKKYLDEDYSIN